MKKRRTQYLMLTIPAILLMLLFIGVPLVNGIRVSFYKWNGYSQNMRFIGIENYTKAFDDKLFYRTLGNTMIYGFGSTILQNILGLGTALLLNQKFKGRNAVRAILYMPIMISGFIMGQILYFFFQLDGGVFNQMLGWFGIPPVYWTETGLKATIVCMLANSWQYMGICMILYLAGLQGIPDMYREAARLDGASAGQVFRHITLPLLIPSIISAVVLNLIGGFNIDKKFTICLGKFPFCDRPANHLFGTFAHVRVHEYRRERLNYIRKLLVLVGDIGYFEHNFCAKLFLAL